MIIMMRMMMMVIMKLTVISDVDFDNDTVLFSNHTTVYYLPWLPYQSMVCLDTLEALKASAAPFITWLQVTYDFLHLQ